MSGTIRRWREDKGFGFLEVDGDAGDEIYFQASSLDPSINPPVPGTRVSFARSRGRSGKPEAVNVRRR
jgi:cold shock CspA family protein